MRIETHQPAAALRLVQPNSVAPAGDVAATAPSSAAEQRPRNPDAISFEALYVNTLPRIPFSEAQRRLQQLRDNLVAATVPGPINFSAPNAARSANPYSISFVRNIDPAEANLRATEAAAQASD